MVNIFTIAKDPTIPNQFDLTIEKIICTNRLRNGAPTNARAMTERSFESFLLNKPITPSNTASGAKTQAVKTVMLFRKLKVSGVIFSWEAPKFAARNSTDRSDVSKDAIPK